MTTPDLFKVKPRARNTDPHTSHTAAKSMVKPAVSLREKCLDAIKTFGPMTGYEVAAKLNMAYSQVHKRLPELRDAGLLTWRYDQKAMDSRGLYILAYETRLSPFGRPCVVWYLADDK